MKFRRMNAEQRSLILRLRSQALPDAEQAREPTEFRDMVPPRQVGWGAFVGPANRGVRWLGFRFACQARLHSSSAIAFRGRNSADGD